MLHTSEEYQDLMNNAREIILPRVEKGIAYLDEYHPDWVAYMDTQRLQMSNCTRCIGGQLMSSYVYLADEIRENTGMCGAELGFDVSYAGPEGFEEGLGGISSTDEYRLLEEIWVEKINERLEP